MTNDRELLELAAKAAGFSLLWEEVDGRGHVSYRADTLEEFSPLEDDGDALRLAVQLKFQVLTNDHNRWGVEEDVSIVRPIGGYSCTLAIEPHTRDPHAATRCAIVRAAAAIGEQHAE